MNHFTPQTATGGDLDWVAFCYVADELSANDRESFEQRLAEDTNACEAVARAMRVAEATSMAFHSIADNSASVEPEISSRGRRNTRATAVAATVAVVLVAMLSVMPRFDTEPAADSAEVADASEIVGLWTTSQDLMTESSAESNEPPASEGLKANETSLAELSVDVPDWLLVALEAESAGGSEILEN